MMNRAARLATLVAMNRLASHTHRSRGGALRRNPVPAALAEAAFALAASKLSRKTRVRRPLGRVTVVLTAREVGRLLERREAQRRALRRRRLRRRLVVGIVLGGAAAAAGRALSSSRG